MRALSQAEYQLYKIRSQSLSWHDYAFELFKKTLRKWMKPIVHGADGANIISLTRKKVFDPRSRALPSTICVSNHIIYWWIEELPWFKLKSRRREQNNQSFGSLYTHREPTPVWSLRSAHRAIARKNKGRDYQSTGHKQLQSTNNNSSDTVSSSHPHFTAWLSFFFKIQYCNSSESDVACKYSRLDHVGLTQNQ